MQYRSVLAFLVGTALFGVVPYFDPVLPDDWTNTMLPLAVGFGGAVAVGALVVLVAGRRDAWWLAPASALAGAVLMNFISEGTRADAFGRGFDPLLLLSDAVFVFLVSGLAAMIGAAVVVVAFDLVGSLRRRRRAG